MEMPLKDEELQSLYVTQALGSCLQCMLTTPRGKHLENPRRQPCSHSSREEQDTEVAGDEPVFPLHDTGLAGDPGDLGVWNIELLVCGEMTIRQGWTSMLEGLQSDVGKGSPHWIK